MGPQDIHLMKIGRIFVQVLAMNFHLSMDGWTTNLYFSVLFCCLHTELIYLHVVNVQNMLTYRAYICVNVQNDFNRLEFTEIFSSD